jgi:hypothetical protein
MMLHCEVRNSHAEEDKHESNVEPDFGMAKSFQPARQLLGRIGR